MIKKTFKYIDMVEKELSLLSREAHHAKTIKNNLKYVEDLASRNIPTLLIKEILGDNNLLQMIANRSYEHVNHFDKIVVIDNKDCRGYRLTLHFWDAEYDVKIQKEELIHNHRFSFWSHVYRGVLLAENFEEAETFSIEKKDFNRYVYKPSTTGNVHACEFDTKVQLTKLNDTYLKYGSTYYLNFSTTHRVVLPQKALCTFVLRGPREREYTNTYNTFYPERGMQSNVPMMTSAQLREKLNRILGEEE